MLISLLLLLAVSSVNSLPRWHQGTIHHDVEAKATTTDTSKFARKFEQKLDHFDRESVATFQQRYFLNDTFYKPDSDAPVFLCVGGEGPPLDYMVLVASDHCNDMIELASKLGALMVALEHRYYGPSNPFDNLATENLVWLNTEQALGDVASFHKLISDMYSLKTTTKWVTWGGSYPGMVSALSRLRYPHLFHASVSSSSPLIGAVDMPGYNDVVAESMANADVGGSPQCLQVVTEGHVEIGALLQSADGRRSLEKTFNLCTPNTLDNPKNAEQFAGDGVVYLPAQSNDPACTSPYCNIAQICTFLVTTANGTNTERLAALSNFQHAGACVSASYDSMISAVKMPSNPERAWLYQTCTEWGFYQTCETGTNCPYVQGLHDLSVDYDICLQAFNISKESVDYQVGYSGVTYGGANIQGTRIIFPNGQIDPWRANGISTSPNAEEPVLLVRGASHHFWTHPILPTDSDYVNDARKVIWDQVTAWLQES